MEEQQKKEVQDVINGILTGEYKFPEGIKEKVTGIVTDSEMFEFISKLLEAQKRKLSDDMQTLLRGNATNEVLGGKMRYLQGKKDAFDSMLFYLFSWKKGSEVEQKKEEQKNEDNVT